MLHYLIWFFIDASSQRTLFLYPKCHFNFALFYRMFFGASSYRKFYWSVISQDFFILLHHIGRFIDAYTDRTFLFFYPKCRFLCFISEDVFWCFILEIFLYIYHPIWNYYCFGLNDILLSLFRRGKGSTSTSVIYYQKHDFSCFRSIRFPRMNFVNK